MRNKDNPNSPLLPGVQSSNTASGRAVPRLGAIASRWRTGTAHISTGNSETSYTYDAPKHQGDAEKRLAKVDKKLKTKPDDSELRTEREWLSKQAEPTFQFHSKYYAYTATDQEGNPSTHYYSRAQVMEHTRWRAEQEFTSTIKKGVHLDLDKITGVGGFLTQCARVFYKSSANQRKQEDYVHNALTIKKEYFALEDVIQNEQKKGTNSSNQHYTYNSEGSLRIPATSASAARSATLLKLEHQQEVRELKTSIKAATEAAYSYSKTRKPKSATGELKTSFWQNHSRERFYKKFANIAEELKNAESDAIKQSARAAITDSKQLVGTVNQGMVTRASALYKRFARQFKEAGIEGPQAFYDADKIRAAAEAAGKGQVLPAKAFTRCVETCKYAPPIDSLPQNASVKALTSEKTASLKQESDEKFKEEWDKSGRSRLRSALTGGTVGAATAGTVGAVIGTGFFGVGALIGGPLMAGIGFAGGFIVGAASYGPAKLKMKTEFTATYSSKVQANEFAQQQETHIAAAREQEKTTQEADRFAKTVAKTVGAIQGLEVSQIEDAASFLTQSMADVEKQKTADAARFISSIKVKDVSIQAGVSAFTREWAREDTPPVYGGLGAVMEETDSGLIITNTGDNQELRQHANKTIKAVIVGGVPLEYDGNNADTLKQFIRGIPGTSVTLVLEDGNGHEEAHSFTRKAISTSRNQLKQAENTEVAAELQKYQREHPGLGSQAAVRTR